MSTPNELQEKGIKLFQERDYSGAAELFRQAQEAYTAAGQTDLAAEMKVNLGLVHRALGEYEQAATLIQEALDVFSGLGDDKRAAQALGNLGGVFAAQGDSEQAMTCYRQAADTFKALGEDKLYGETLLALADLQVRSGQILTGAATYEVGLENLDQLSGRQKILRGLLDLRRRLIGSGAPPTGKDE